MLRATKEWDVRCPQELTSMFPVRKGYYYKVTRKQARAMIDVLCNAYSMPPSFVTVADTGPGKDCNGCCYYLKGRRSRIHVHERGHFKTVWHEFYHALEHYTNGKYNSSDAHNLAWEFADRLFEIFRKQR